jgi:hypothetical protein
VIIKIRFIAQMRKYVCMCAHGSSSFWTCRTGETNCSGACFALKLAIRLSAIRAVSGKMPPCNHGVLAISDAA